MNIRTKITKEFVDDLEAAAHLLGIPEKVLNIEIKEEGVEE